MDLEQTLHMNAGRGDYSYENNSSQQKEAILKAKPMLQENLSEIYRNGFPDCIRFADMGCASGPNSLLPAWETLHALHRICLPLNRKPPELQVFLNDLPGNDFNSVFKSFPSFYERLKKERRHEFGSCFIAAAPGSFYGRLFPPSFLHLVHSSYSIHWLSQVPKGLVSESGIPILNKRGVYVEKSLNPPDVHKAYLDQFECDFTSFLKLRFEELKREGRMILIIMGNDKYHPHLLEPIEMVINDMVSEGLIEESKLESFNFPIYSPCAEEVKQVIEREGSFSIHQFETFHVSWLVGFDDNNNNNNKELDQSDKDAKGKYVAKHIRAVLQTLLRNHFGDDIMDDLFRRYSIKVSELMEMGLGAYTILLLSLIKK